MDLLSGRKGALALTLVFTLVLTLLCGCTAVAGPSAAPQTAAPAGEAPVADIDPDAVVVSTVDGLLSAIAPGASIVLEPGVYDLSAASSYGQDDSGSSINCQALAQVRGTAGYCTTSFRCPSPCRVGNR